ncbi:4-coumarate--CoA ligase 1-like [Leguminivora glycinivorella]|uniref:4-coumarate--CoA ligase 1-like n=1 Tax=Leguminivora glycinivorella TaxID=1035111 RepID=UPI00200F4925|nr:4-coumarate--CoA ligase 1-like [Leguminivora glycinivorella]
MLKHPFYQYGPSDLELPVNLNFSEFILDKLVEFKDRTIINGATEETITYGDIAQKAMNLAISLSRLGVRKGQVVGICSENRTEFWSALVGSICTGAALTTFNMMYTKHEITHVASISKPKYVFCSPLAYKMHEKNLKSLKFIEKIIVFGDEKPAGTISYKDLVSTQEVKYEDFRAADVNGPEDTLFILYSSGTTGLPKGVALSHLNALISSRSRLIETPNPPKYLIITPWFHTMGLMGSLLYLIAGRDMVYLPKFEIELYLKCIEKYKVTRLSVVPPVLVAIVKYPNKYDLSTVEIVYSGAAPLTKETADAVRDKFPNVKSVLQGYGMTETSLAVTKCTDEMVKSGTVGRVMPGAIIKIIDLKTRKPVGANQPGEVCVKGGLVMKGYIGKDRREDFDDEGFFRTGDVGYYDEDGDFFIVDRLKELIKYKGYQVAPAELEAVLLQHPAVRDAGVVGIPDSRAGELPRAFVVLQPGATATAEDLKTFVAEKLSNPKHLRGGVRFVAEIPKNPSGKILRRELRKLAQQSKL